MTEVTTGGLQIVRRRERVDPIDDRRLRLALQKGTWVKITTGAFAEPSEWDIDVLGPWPSTLDVLYPASSGGRSGGSVRRHPGDAADAETVPLGRHLVTTPAQTALDLARSLPFVNGVAAVDQAVCSDRAGGALTTLAEVFDLLERAPDHPRYARALRAISFANPLAANVRESQSRVVIAQLGFPTPRLQERRVLRTGRLVFGAFYFPPARPLVRARRTRQVSRPAISSRPHAGRCGHRGAAAGDRDPPRGLRVLQVGAERCRAAKTGIRHPHRRWSFVGAAEAMIEQDRSGRHATPSAPSFSASAITIEVADAANDGGRVVGLPRRAGSSGGCRERGRSRDGAETAAKRQAAGRSTRVWVAAARTASAENGHGVSRTCCQSSVWST